MTGLGLASLPVGLGNVTILLWLLPRVGFMFGTIASQATPLCGEPSLLIGKSFFMLCRLSNRNNDRDRTFLVRLTSLPGFLPQDYCPLPIFRGVHRPFLLGQVSNVAEINRFSRLLCQFFERD